MAQKYHSQWHWGCLDDCQHTCAPCVHHVTCVMVCNMWSVCVGVKTVLVGAESVFALRCLSGSNLVVNGVPYAAMLGDTRLSFRESQMQVAWCGAYPSGSGIPYGVFGNYKRLAPPMLCSTSPGLRAGRVEGGHSSAVYGTVVASVVGRSTHSLSTL